MDTDSIEKRICTICKNEKELKEFETSRFGRFGKGSRCNVCNKARMKEKRALNAEYWQNHDPYKEHKSGSKFCRKCKTDKPVADFAVGGNNPDGLQRYCRVCAVDIWQKREYGVQSKPGDKCEICGEQAIGKSRLHIDHCHKSGRVRGILCSQCNTALGSFKDSEYLLQKAIAYLRKV